MNVVSPSEGQTFAGSVPVKFVIAEPGCDVAFEAIIDGREYAPMNSPYGPDNEPAVYAPIRGSQPGGRLTFAGCGSGPRVWRGTVDLPPGQHRLRLSGCPQGTNVANAYSSPKVVRFSVAEKAGDASSLPDTGVPLSAGVAALSAVLAGTVLLRGARQLAR